MTSAERQRVLDHFESTSRVGGNQYKACCPAHEDRNPSLSIAFTDDKVLINCFAGCDTADVLRAAGLEWNDLRIDNAKPPATADSVEYDYVDEHGQPLFQVVRRANKRFSLRRETDDGEIVNGIKAGWYRKGKDAAWSRIKDAPLDSSTPPEPEARWFDEVDLVPYHLDSVAAAAGCGETIFVVEGEKDVDCLRWNGLTATTNPQGAGKWRQVYGQHCKGTDVVVIPDNDEPGEKHACQVAESVAQHAQSVKIVRLPNVEEGGDVSDWFAAGGTVEGLERLAEGTPEYPSRLANDDAEKSMLQQLVDLAQSYTLIRSPEGELFAWVGEEDERDLYSLIDGQFEALLIRQYAKIHRKTANSQALRDAIRHVKAHAARDASREPVHIRVAEKDEVIYLDLADETKRVVEITPSGWQVKPTPAHLYIMRTSPMHAIPRPVEGDIDELRSLVNLADRSDWILLVAWLLATLKPRGPFPILVLQGEQGTGKSTIAKMLRKLVDPHSMEVRAAPGSNQDLMISARNNWVLAFDNLSGLKDWLSDSLCRLATGGGFSTRELYSNHREFIIEAQRPIIVNGIDDIITRGDLLDRSLVITLPRIEEHERQPEDKIWKAFERARPRILGGLLTAASCALNNVDRIDLDAFPRMADFAKWVSAAEPALPWSEGEFLAAYNRNQRESVTSILELDCVAEALATMMAQQNGDWTGTATMLLEELRCHAPESVQKSREWPKTAQSLGGRLTRIAPNLKHIGITIEREQRSTDRRPLTIHKTARGPVMPVMPVTNTARSKETDDNGQSHRTPVRASESPPRQCSTKFDDSNDGSDRSPSNVQGTSRREELADHQRAMLEEYEEDRVPNRP